MGGKFWQYIWGKYLCFPKLLIYGFTFEISNFEETFQITSQVQLRVA